MSGRPALALSLPWRSRPGSPDWLQELVDRMVAGGLATAATALVGDRRGELAGASAGDARSGAGRSEPLYDLASLSKPWTASLALRLDRRGRLPLATELGALWSPCHPRLARRTLEDLLRHRAGFRPWTPLYRRCRSGAAVARLLVGGELLGARRGTYSDLDYVLWGLSAERALGRPLAELMRRELLTPLGLRWRPSRQTRWLRCRLDNRRERQLAEEQGVRVAPQAPPPAGRAQDGNARFLDPPAGHSGLFATPSAMLALAREWLAPGRLWPSRTVATALQGPGKYVLGWQRPTRRGSGGPALGPGSFGHLGFTGGSVWLDPGRRRVMVLLAHRAAHEADLAASRRRFHKLVLAGATGG